MRKSIILTIAISLVSGCAENSADTILSPEKCWGELKVGTSVNGSGFLYYFQNNSTYISNKKCPNKSILLRFSESGSEILNSKFEYMKNKNSNLLGIKLISNIKGNVISHYNGHALVDVREFSFTDHADPISMDSK